MSPAPPGSRQSLGFELLGWVLCLASLAWAYSVHQGIGPPPYGLELAWYEPRGFMRGWGFLGWAFHGTARLLVVLGLPSALLAAGVFVASRSALARALSVAAALAVLLFGFYGSVALRVWEFFFWRGSAVLALTALALGFALTAPLLARSWLRLAWPLRTASYLPVAFAVVAFIRNATGTDPELRYAISPWPAVPFYGIEVGGLFAMLCYGGAAIALLVMSRWPDRRALVLAVGAALLAPLALLWLCDLGALLPLRVDTRVVSALLTLDALTLGVALPLALSQPEALPRRTTALGVGAALLALPIVGGQAWARLDYSWTREHQARKITDALERYLARETLYPDELSQLVEAGDLPAIPRPAIGFAMLGDGEFGFSSFGTSYLLDFAAPRWVQCAYAPPYAEEEEEEEIQADSPAVPEDGWSCPKRPPELW